MLEFATDVAREAGRILMRQLGRLSSTDITHKGRVDLVTSADRETEALIVARIQNAFSEHGVVAEESGLAAPDATHRWIIDPLDGTTNYVHGYPSLPCRSRSRSAVRHASPSCTRR